MTTLRRPAGGFTLIEVIIAVAIIGVLLGLGVPMFASWQQNVRIRSTAESIFNGMQLARSEAIKNNATACFVSLPDAAAVDTQGASWCVTRRDPAVALACGTANEITRHESPYLTSADAIVPVGALPVCFNGSGARPLGSVQTNIRVSLAAAAGTATDEHRTLEIRVSPMGQTRTCDPDLPNTDPRSCT